MTKERLLILDGNSLMHRAFYAIPDLTNKEGIHTNAVYGFSNMLFKMREEMKPNYIVTTFDRKAPTFRHKEYTDYKAGRKKMPEELAQQFPIVKDLLAKLAISIFEIDGFEADDLIGTLAKFAEEKGIEVYIITGDKDALQLASDNINVVINKKGITEKEIYNKSRFIEDFQITPTQFIDVKGLMGDSSDNIPGVPGIGEKTAFKLIKEYGSIENVLMNIENISGKKLKENLTTYSEQAIFSKHLATIITNVPIEINLDEIKSKEDFDAEQVRKIFLELEFKSLIKKIPNSEDIVKREVDVKFEEINTLDGLKEVFNSIKSTVFIICDIINASVFSKSYIRKMYINFDDKNYVIDTEILYNFNKDEYINTIKDVFENDSVEKVIYDVKDMYTVLNKDGIDLHNVIFDIKIASYLINPSQDKYTVSTILENEFGISLGDENISIKEVSFMKKVYDKLKEDVKKFNMEELLYNVELPLAKILAIVEMNGFKIDREKLNEIGIEFKTKIEKLQSEIYALSEEEFNINSPKQLGKILFEKLDLPIIKKTKTGYSTNAEVLEKLKDKHPIISKISDYRQITKLYSTYVEGLKPVIEKDDKIHSNFNQTVTTTGRLSSTEPNLQNIPIKYEMGRKIRKVFIPNSEDCIILSADYSQIELRVLAHISNDENLINAFKHHSDIHSKTASEVFRVPIDEVTSYMRSDAKAVNFGIIYGIGDFSLAKDLNISRKEAKQYIDTYFERYPNVAKYMENIIEEAKKSGYVTTILNRRRFIPEIRSSNKIVKALGERLAMNTPIQGSAADIIKVAMVNVYNALKNKKLKSTIILQVHDELILNVYKNELNEVESIVKQEMENALNLRVPLEIEINKGTNWYEAK